MQSSLNTNTESVSILENDQNHERHTQHGSNNHDNARASPVREGSSIRSAASNAAGETGAGRLSPKSRIEEYENASQAKTQKQDGTAFQVIKANYRTISDRAYLSELPNEIMIHVLSHLPPTDLATVALLSKRFHDLVTSPHAWRSAFARYFPGSDSVGRISASIDIEPQAIVRSERRAFTRLTPRATWRSEYMLRTRLLRSLARGKPVQLSASNSTSQSSRARNVSPEITYGSEIFGSVNHLHATWIVGLNQRSARFIHGADDIGMCTASDPATAKVGRWGLTDPQLLLQFSDRFPGDAQYGLGPGEIIGVPNVMDISQPYGMLYGEGFPGGMSYYRGSDETRGRYLLSSSDLSSPRDGVPRLAASQHSTTSVWLAKSAAIPGLTDGMIGLLTGSSNGSVTAYSIGSPGPSNNRNARYTRGEITARWMLSPGVPIIAIAVDNEHSLKRRARSRIWAVVMNALGEVFYLTQLPRRARTDQAQANEEHRAWQTGRSVYWNMIETSRRTTHADPYNERVADGSYSPRSSWNGMCLTPEQVEAETLEIQAFVDKKPKDFRRVCDGWDMRRKLHVDFASDDENNAGEAVVVLECGLDEGMSSNVKRYLRLRGREKAEFSFQSTPSMTTTSTPPSSSPSMFGGSRSPALAQPTPFSIDSLESTLSHEDFDGLATPRPISEDWIVSRLGFGGLKKVQIVATAIDSSIHATQTLSEDPLFNTADVSAASSPSLGPWCALDNVAQTADVPGQRARLLAIGTQVGCIAVWNIRESIATDTTTSIEPLRIIFTDSPQISSLALTSLYLVHGGSDGLVQAWDPLASNNAPIRTLHSRFSSRARRQLVQAQASPQGIGTNMYAAAAICLDPDSTSLRGVVALGNRLRYWAYSSSAADQYKASKRRLRRSERGSNNGGERFAGATRTNLKDYIANERFELDREKKQRQKDADRFAGRFGTDLMDGSEEEMIAYAAMLSQESHAAENMRSSSDTASMSASPVSGVESNIAWSSDVASTPPGSAQLRPALKTDEELDADIAEAIRQSMEPSQSPSHDIPIRIGKTKQRKSSSTRPSPKASPQLAGSSKAAALSDLDFAIQLSIAEEASKNEH